MSPINRIQLKPKCFSDLSLSYLGYKHVSVSSSFRSCWTSCRLRQTTETETPSWSFCVICIEQDLFFLPGFSFHSSLQLLHIRAPSSSVRRILKRPLQWCTEWKRPRHLNLSSLPLHGGKQRDLPNYREKFSCKWMKSCWALVHLSACGAAMKEFTERFIHFTVNAAFYRHFWDIFIKITCFSRDTDETEEFCSIKCVWRMFVQINILMKFINEQIYVCICISFLSSLFQLCVCKYQTDENCVGWFWRQQTEETYEVSLRTVNWLVPQIFSQKRLGHPNKNWN